MGSTVLVLTGLRKTSRVLECNHEEQAARFMSQAFGADVVVSSVASGKSWYCFGDDKRGTKVATLRQNVAAAVLMAAIHDVDELYFGIFVFKFTGKIIREKVRNWFRVYQDEEEFERVCDEDSRQAFVDMFHKPPLIGDNVENSSRKRKR